VAVTEIVDVEYEPWGGYDDPRLPTQVWKGRIFVTGDASGGDISAFLRFNLANAPRLDRFFSMEELYLRTGSQVAETVLMETRNFGSVRTGTRLVSTALSLVVTEGVSAGFNVISMRDSVPVFLGQQVNTGNLMEIIWQWDNVDTITMTIWAGGYVWGPRSASAKNGGIVRPSPGLFTP